MSILKRYYLSPIIKLSVLFSIIIDLLYLIIDFFNNLSYFIDKHAVISDILKYYIYQFPAIFIMFFPLGLLTSIYFSLAHRGKWNENIAVKSLGIKLSTITNAVFYLGGIFMILLIFLNLYLVPQFNSISNKIKSEKIDHVISRHRYERDIYFVGKNRVLYSARYIDTKKKKLFNLTTIKSDSFGKIVERNDCDYALWNGNYWKLYNVRKRIFKDNENVSKYFEYPIMEDSSLNVPPEKLVSGNITLDNMTISELLHYAQYMKAIGQTTKKIYTQIYYLLFYPLSVLIFVLLGINLGIRSSKASDLFEFGLSLLIGFLYWGTVQSFRALGDAGGMSPVFAGLLPHIIFFGITILTIILLKETGYQR